MSKAHNWIIIFILPLLFQACYTATDGCLDVLSSNYDVAADNSCDDCCVYPQLEFDYQMVYNDSIQVSTDSIFTTDFGQDFQINKSYLLFSDIKLKNIDGVLRSVRDSIALNTSPVVYVKDAFWYDSLFKSSNDIGDFIFPETYLSAQFLPGVRNSINKESSSGVRNNHPLKNAQNNLCLPSDENTFAFAFVELALRPESDSIIYDLFIPSQDELIELNFQNALNLSRGDGATISVKFDAAIFTNGIDFETMNSNEIEAYISSKTIEAFSLAE